jgi:hypothetical protein
MSKTTKSAVHHTVEAKRWELSRERTHHLSADHAGPIQMDWRKRENYSATDLDYRGRNKT